MEALVRNRVVYQALSPACASELQRWRGQRIQPSSLGDSKALLKLSRRQALDMARRVLCVRHPWAVVVELSLASVVLDQYPLESVAYEDHREFVIPVPQLGALSVALLTPIKVVETLRSCPGKAAGPHDPSPLDLSRYATETASPFAAVPEVATRA